MWSSLAASWTIVNAADSHVRPYAQGYKGFERTKNDPCNEAQKFIKITRMELIFNARQLSWCPELPAGHGNYACWQKSTAASSEQRRNSRLQDGKTLEGLQTRPDPVYEPMSVNHILRFGQKLDSAAGIQRDLILLIFNALARYLHCHHGFQIALSCFFLQSQWMNSFFRIATGIKINPSSTPRTNLVKKISFNDPIWILLA